MGTFSQNKSPNNFKSYYFFSSSSNRQLCDINLTINSETCIILDDACELLLELIQERKRTVNFLLFNNLHF